MEDTKSKFEKKLNDLQELCGFTIEHTPSKQGSAVLIHLHHPYCNLDYEIPQPQAGDSKALDAAYNKLLEITEVYHASVEVQNAQVKLWSAQGWNITTTVYYAEGEDQKLMQEGRSKPHATLVFSYEGDDPRAKGKSFSVTGHFEYGDYVFNADRVKQKIDELLPPKSAVTGVKHQGSRVSSRLFTDVAR